jgi:hypothetical protein
MSLVTDDESEDGFLEDAYHNGILPFPLDQLWRPLTQTDMEAE